MYKPKKCKHCHRYPILFTFVRQGNARQWHIQCPNPICPSREKENEIKKGMSRAKIVSWWNLKYGMKERRLK